MIILTFIFAFFAVLAVIGQFKYGISWHPFYFKENTYYFAFQILLNTALAMAFYLTAKEEENEEGMDLCEEDKKTKDSKEQNEIIKNKTKSPADLNPEH